MKARHQKVYRDQDAGLTKAVEGRWYLRCLLTSDVTWDRDAPVRTCDQQFCQAPAMLVVCKKREGDLNRAASVKKE